MTEFQSELFEEFIKPEKKREIQKSHPIVRRYRLFLNISYEQLVFFVIALIMIMVLVFSLGVERGKSLLETPAPVEPEIAREPEIELPSSTEIQKEVVLKPPPQEIIKKVSKPYTIQVATYRQKKSAKKELENLRKRGLDSYIISNNGKYEVCVGEYVDRDSAKKNIKRLKKDYKDCFLRRR